ncbi:MAG TPA: alpha/beta hydrolase [Microlunatus sp.]
MSAVDVDGLRVAFTRTGDGPPVVLLGGFVGDRTATWRNQIEALSTSCTVVAWDAPGSGESADVPESFRLPDYADCLAGLLSALTLEQPVLVGLSFGGALALEFFRRHHSQVRGLFLAGAYAGWAGSLPPDTVRQRLAASIQASRLPPDEFVSALLPSMFSDAAPKDRVVEFGASMAANFRPPGFRAMAFASAEADLRDVLPLVDVPTVVLHGADDIRAPRDVAAALHAAIPASRLVVLPHVGHVSCVEAPEQFTAEVQAFLRGQQLL